MPLSLDQISVNSAKTEAELSFLHAVEFGDVDAAATLLSENPGLNVDVTDGLGRSALRLAVKNENKELVALLVEVCNCENVHQAALQAIHENHTAIAELILKDPHYIQICHKRRRLGDTDGFFKKEVESQFSTDMTPLNLAAQKNNYTIVQLLLLRGEIITKPDKVDCACQECRNRMKFDELRVANFRLNAYRGLASEAYVALSSRDPFLVAFQLAKELRTLAYEETHFKKEYKNLANQLSDFVVKLLDRVWTQQELDMVLNAGVLPGPGSSNQSTPCSSLDSGGARKSIGSLGHLKMALENREKKFVAHPSVQQYLIRMWHHGLHSLDAMSASRRIFHLMLLSLAYPCLVVASYVKPDWKWSHLGRQPQLRFLGHMESFFVFLAAIIAVCWEMQTRDLVSENISLGSSYLAIHQHYTQYRHVVLGYKSYKHLIDLGPDLPLRQRKSTGIERLLFIWLLGMVLLETQKLQMTGARVHFRNLFNIVEFFLLATYISVFSLFLFVMGKTNSALEALGKMNSSVMVQNPNVTISHLYWITADRLVWDAHDPSHVAEGLFAMANIVSFSRIIYLLPANEALGPLQISLRRMIGDIMKVLLLGAFSLGGFIVSLRNLYSWYSEQVHRQALKETRAVRNYDFINTTNAATSFMDIRKQFITVFWWIYGRGPMNEALTMPTQYEHQSQLTAGIGEVLSALYHVSVIVVIYNLFIAMMTRTFERIVDDVNAEWKYARSLLYMEYLSDCCPAPVPVNLLQVLHDVIRGALTCVREWRPWREEVEAPAPAAVGKRRLAFVSSTGRVPQAKQSSPFRLINSATTHSPRRVKTSSRESADDLTYQQVVELIVQRYIFDMQREDEMNKGNAELARQHLSDTRWDMLDLMRAADTKNEQLLGQVQAAVSELSADDPHCRAHMRRYRWHSQDSKKSSRQDNVRL